MVELRKRMPYVKICGFLDPLDARAAARFGADLVGLNFYPGSPRAVSFGLARKIQEVVHAVGGERGTRRPVRTVAVLQDPTPEFVLEMLQEVRPDLLQFHGDEPPHVCQYFKTPFLKTFRLRGAGDVATIARYQGGFCVGHVIEPHAENELAGAVGSGGTRSSGAAGMLSQTLARDGLAVPRGFLSGGLTAANVGARVRELRPYGVDVMAGVESRPGVKHHELMAQFIREVREAALSD
jgi:phosphoribosylanthranilate isomerase